MNAPPQCDSARCSNVAELEVFWPGQTCVKCDHCLRQALGVAGVMGFRLDFRPLPHVVAERRREHVAALGELRDAVKQGPESS